MPDVQDRSSGRAARVGKLSMPLACAVLSAALILAGALLWFRPYLTAKRPVVAEVPAPAALFVVTEFSLPPGAQACMSTVTVTPQSQVASFQLRPAKPTPSGGPPVDLVLSAPGYRSVLAVPGGYPGGSVALPITPPKRPEIGTACFVNKGRSTVLLPGTTEPRTVSRSGTLINGKSVVGDIALSFLASTPQSLLDRLGEVFGHASNLTDHLAPAWLIWVLAVLVAFCVPIGIVAAFFIAMRESEAASAGAS
jgi:hypothetical protein